MRSVRKLIAVIMLMSLCIMNAVGCKSRDIGNDNNVENGETKEMKVELTKRQIDILEAMKLPTDYNELSLDQKSAIESIETLLTYLEEKYGTAFNYAGYAAADADEKEHLKAYPSDGDKNDLVTVYRSYEDGKIQYEDDYANILVKPQYEASVCGFLSQYIDMNSTKVFCKILSVDDDVKEENVPGSVSSTVYVYIEEAACSGEQYDSLVDACGQWLKENWQGRPSGILLLKTDGAQLEKINESNYEDKIREDIFSADTECSVSSEGIVNTYVY